MDKNIRLTVILCLIFVALVFALTYFRITRNNDVSLSPEALREVGAMVYEAPVVLQPFSLVDHRGQAFTQEQLKGQWSLIFFGFTSCPDICPLTLTELSQFYRQLEAESGGADRPQVIMVSVDPARDSTEKMAEYMGSFHEDFVGLNGPYDDVAALARQLFVSHEPPPVVAAADDPHAGHAMPAAQDYLIDHSGNILIINPEGNYHGFLDAAIQDPEITLAYQSIRADY
jgi:protein SCO1/2